MQYDVIVLTDHELLALNEADWYSRQVHTEDGLVLQALEKLGLKVGRKDWADPDFDWADCRSAVFRTTWDYFHRFGEFAPWLARVSQTTRLFNEAALIHWNIDKHYLGALAEKDVNIVPTVYIERGDARSLAHIVAETGWDEVILKPAVSGSARHTYRFAATDSEQHECVFGELIEQEAMMLQPFQRNILEQGELSLMIIDGKYTHAIRKTAKAGDFRVQDDHGGTVHRYEASADEILFAEAAVAAVPFDVLYARVDLIRDNDGALAIMELEMIEPELFFRFCPSAADTLASGIARRLQA
ncbi:RimK family alpha-L-glutamate ligase [Vogesella amnigena]|uniref:RimK family alpha-L-glutamate ligase n=1 Tax=Vogesella amnigena TaxID=1507449 RepID=A0ABV7TU14_9NEIS